MALPVSYFSVEVADNTINQRTGAPETASYSLAIETATPANVATIEGNIGGLVAAFQGITIGRVIKQDFSYSVNKNEKIPATSDLAQRENKWLCRYHDTTTFKKFVVSIPCADLTKKQANSEFVNLATGAGAAVKTAFEQLVVSPDDPTHAVVLDSIQFVGRPG